MIALSTRCQILFRHGDHELLTYRHSDGYPEGVIPDLKRFLEWYPRPYQFEYATATWFYFQKRKVEEWSHDGEESPTEQKELDNNDHVALGYGICANERIHNDIEHFYLVDLETGEIEHYGPIRNWNGRYETYHNLLEVKEAEQTVTVPVKSRDGVRA